MKRVVIIFTLLLGISTISFAQNNEITLPQKPKRAKTVDYSVKDSGYWLATQAGVSYCGGKLFGQFDFVNGYRFSEFLKVGVGVSPRIGIKSIPVYVDLRGNFFSQADRMFAICWNVDGGYAFNNGGIYASPSVGMRFGGIRHNFIVGINYMLQGQENDDEHPLLHAVGLRIGYEF